MRPVEGIAERLALLQRRVAGACRRAGREPESVAVVAVSKRQPLARLRAAVEAGHRVFGENQVQEAEGKVPLFRDEPQPLEWHLVGPLQSNKIRRAAPLFDAVQSIDRLKVGHRLNAELERLGKRLPVFLQVHLGEEPTKHGFPPGSLTEAVRPLAECGHLEVVGLMAIPPYEPQAEGARRWFRQLRELRDELFSSPEWLGRPGWLSMGMSHDFEVAVEEGATHVRVGTAIFGPRPPVRASPPRPSG